MKTAVTTLALVGALALGTGPAAAQMQGHKNEVHVYVGSLFGDDLTDTEVSGKQPELDDDVTFGVRYAYDFTKVWSIEGSIGFSPNSVIDLAGGDVDMDVLIVDVDGLWHFTPDARVVGYLVFGAGFATADLDRPIQGTVNGLNVEINDDSGFTLNAGVGAKFFTTKSFLIRAEARYRYFDKLVDNFDDSPNTVETTVGAGWVF